MAEARETVWVPSAAHGFLPAFVAAAVDAPPSDLVEYSVCLGANRKRLSTVDATGTVPLSELRPREASASCVGDMTELTDVSEPALLHNLYLRFCADHIYSSVGGILVSVNPYKAVPRLYDERAVSHYRTCALNKDFCLVAKHEATTPPLGPAECVVGGVNLNMNRFFCVRRKLFCAKVQIACKPSSSVDKGKHFPALVRQLRLCQLTTMG